MLYLHIIPETTPEINPENTTIINISADLISINLDAFAVMLTKSGYISDAYAALINCSYCLFNNVINNINEDNTNIEIEGLISNSCSNIIDIPFVPPDTVFVVFINILKFIAEINIKNVITEYL